MQQPWEPQSNVQPAAGIDHTSPLGQGYISPSNTVCLWLTRKHRVSHSFLLPPPIELAIFVAIPASTPQLTNNQPHPYMPGLQDLVSLPQHIFATVPHSLCSSTSSCRPHQPGWRPASLPRTGAWALLSRHFGGKTKAPPWETSHDYTIGSSHLTRLLSNHPDHETVPDLIL